MDNELRGKINRLINECETITYYKHHYIRKTGLKKKLKDLLEEILCK